MKIKKLKIAVIGLGYVGLPLAVEFAKKHKVIGFDINPNRVNELNNGIDKTLEIKTKELNAVSGLTFTNKIRDLKNVNFYIVTVPTPIDINKKPDLIPLIQACESIGQHLKNNDIVVFESTVYPGATEEICVPILEKISGLKFNKDFFCGYSPERINPGDKLHKLPDICKITSGSNEYIADFVDKVYAEIITAGTYKVPSIKIAEAAKVIENTQRDINIALINELAIILNKLNIDTETVLQAAGTKWNFLSFRPGLVGGHCIGVDPYYLTFKAEALGYKPEVILSGRRINDGMGAYIAGVLVKKMVKASSLFDGAPVLIMGISFKENCPDVRNSRVIDIISELKQYGCVVDVYDPWVNAKDVKEEYGIEILSTLRKKKYNAVIIAVGHKQFIEMDCSYIRSLMIKEGILFDVKSILPIEKSDIRL